MNKMISLSYFALTLSFFLMLLAPSALGQLQQTTDFSINVTSANDLTYTGFRYVEKAQPGKTNITTGYLPQFPALAGTGLSVAHLEFGANSINTLHSHPRGSEILILLSGSITAGIVDTSNRLFVQTLQPGDVFLIPLGLLHFQVNNNNETATAVVAFSSPNAGRLTFSNAVFNSNPRIDVGFLQAALTLDAPTIERLFTVPFIPVGAPYS